MGQLSLALWTPAVGALLIALTPRDRRGLIRALALLHGALAAVQIWATLLSFDPSQGGLQLVERDSFHAETGMSYALGVDGLSLPLVLLTTLVALLALVAAHEVTEHVKSFHVWFLVLETATLGMYLAADWTLFYMFLEATLIPLFFLISRWGGPGRGPAGLSFVLYTMGGSVFLLLGLLVLYGVSPTHSFDMEAMAAAGRALPLGLQIGLLLSFFVGFGVKVPVVGLHGWLPPAYVEASTPVSMMLGVLKVGAYGLIRAGVTLPQGAARLSGALGALAILTILYGGLLAWRQRDLKAMIAYSSVSHMGVVLLGIATLNEAGLLGANLMVVAHGLIAALLFFLVGGLARRAKTRDIGHFGGLARVTPRLAALTSLVLMASLGLPGLAGFAAELHAIVGAMQRWGWWVGLASLGALIGAAYAVRSIGLVFAGPPRPGMAAIADLSRIELLASLPLALLVVGLGLAPSLALGLMAGTVTAIVPVFR